MPGVAFTKPSISVSRFVMCRAERVLTELIAGGVFCQTALPGSFGREILDLAASREDGCELSADCVHGFPQVIILRARVIIRVGDARIASGPIPIGLKTDDCFRNTIAILVLQS